MQLSSPMDKFQGAQIVALGYGRAPRATVAPNSLSRVRRQACSGRGDGRKRTAHTAIQTARAMRLPIEIEIGVQALRFLGLGNGRDCRSVALNLEGNAWPIERSIERGALSMLLRDAGERVLAGAHRVVVPEPDHVSSLKRAPGVVPPVPYRSRQGPLPSRGWKAYLNGPTMNYPGVQYGRRS